MRAYLFKTDTHYMWGWRGAASRPSNCPHMTRRGRSYWVQWLRDPVCASMRRHGVQAPRCLFTCICL